MLNREYTDMCISRAAREFENFEADINEYGDLTVIDWRNKNGSGNWAVRYILDGCRLIISGDIGNAMFRRPEPYTLKYCSEMLSEPGYNARKCVAKDEGGIYSWDRAYAKDDLDRLFSDFTVEEGFSRETIVEVEDIKAELLASCYHNGIHIEPAIAERLSELDLDWEFTDAIQTCGMQYSLHYIAWLVGLKMICDQQIHSFVQSVCLNGCDLGGCKISAWDCPKFIVNPDNRWTIEGGYTGCWDTENYMCPKCGKGAGTWSSRWAESAEAWKYCPNCGRRIGPALPKYHK